MNLTYLQTFLIVAEENSFTKAADKLDVSKGLVSRHVSHLEKSLNAKLFHRTTRRIVLSEIGEEVFLKAKQIQLLAAEAEIRVKDITQEFSGDLKITAPFEFGKALCHHVIPSFIQQHPQINLILDFGPVKNEIASGDFDIAFRAFEELPNDVVAQELGYIKNVLVCSNNFDRANEINVMSDLHGIQFILNSQNAKWNKLLLFSDEQSYQIEVSGSIAANTYSAMLELTDQDMGVACLPFYQVEQLIKDGKLIHLLPNWAAKTHKLNVLYAQRALTPQKIIMFIKAVKTWLCAKNQYLL